MPLGQPPRSIGDGVAVLSGVGPVGPRRPAARLDARARGHAPHRPSSSAIGTHAATTKDVTEHLEHHAGHSRTQPRRAVVDDGGDEHVESDPNQPATVPEMAVGLLIKAKAVLTHDSTGVDGEHARSSAGAVAHAAVHRQAASRARGHADAAHGWPRRCPRRRRPQPAGLVRDARGGSERFSARVLPARPATARLTSAVAATVSDAGATRKSVAEMAQTVSFFARHGAAGAGRQRRRTSSRS